MASDYESEGCQVSWCYLLWEKIFVVGNNLWSEQAWDGQPFLPVWSNGKENESSMYRSLPLTPRYSIKFTNNAHGVCWMNTSEDSGSRLWAQESFDRWARTQIRQCFSRPISVGIEPSTQTAHERMMNGAHSERSQNQPDQQHSRPDHLTPRDFYENGILHAHFGSPVQEFWPEQPAVLCGLACGHLT